MAAGLERFSTTEHGAESAVRGAETATGMEDFFDDVRALAPKDDAQRYLQGQAVQIASDLAQSRWMLIEQSQNSLPTMFLVVLIAWLTVLFIAFGLLTPPNPTAIFSLLICGISIAVAIFLILELNRPLEGSIRVSRAPLQKALALIGR